MFVLFYLFVSRFVLSHVTTLLFIAPRSSASDLRVREHGRRRYRHPALRFVGVVPLCCRIYTEKLPGKAQVLRSLCHLLHHLVSLYDFMFPFQSYFIHVLSLFRFSATPIVILVAAYAIDDYIRATVVNGIELFIAFCGQAFFLVSAKRFSSMCRLHVSMEIYICAFAQVLTIPTKANKTFPFHVKTTKVRLSCYHVLN